VKEPYLFQSASVEWQPHPTLPGIQLKSLQNSSVSPPASVSLVEVKPGGEIVPHMHQENHETAFILAGSAVLTLPSGDHVLAPGDGVTVPPGTLHSLRNTSDAGCLILAYHLPPLL
jgi:quercetin dioxygenase-like cupin family protein